MGDFFLFMNLTHKIIARFTKDAVAQSNFVSLAPHRVMTHDNTHAVMSKFELIGNKIFNNNQLVFALDHDIQNPNNKHKYAQIQAFAKSFNVDFYAAGQGIGHQIMIEQGYAFPQTLTVASDSHSNMYGGIGCLGTPIVRTDAAAIWASGLTWWQVPPVARVYLYNELPPGVTGKDVIITLCHLFNNDQVLNHAVEFCGPAISTLSIDDRLTISNMTTEWGALTGLFPVDNLTMDWLNAQMSRLAPFYPTGHPRINSASLDNLQKSIIYPDQNAVYARELSLDLSTVVPVVSGPNSVKKAALLADLIPKKINIQKAYLVSCTNSRASDIREAAAVVKGKHVHPNVEFYVSAASKGVQHEAELAGDWQDLINAGAKPLPSGCGPCIGLGAGLLQDGETGISASNRNYKGRMGSPNANAYLSSPAIVAASALAGYITGPSYDKRMPIGSFKANNQAPPKPSESVIIEGFHSILHGELLFCDMDNINTDAIYPGKYTYRELSKDEMSKVVMENYDPSMAARLHPQIILVGGYNFGTGSSREQAATALLAAGVKLVIAGSFSETFKRNSINNGLLVLEAPLLVEYLRKSKQYTVGVEIDLGKGRLNMGTRHFEIPVVGRAAQELIVQGGLENWVKNRLNQ
jgi:homoaconitate hydratase